MSATVTGITSSAQVERFLEGCKKGKINVVRQYKGSYDVIDKKGRTPLMLAALNKSEKLFSHVLDQTSKESLHQVDNQGQNVLFYACRSGVDSRVRKLYDMGVKVIRASNGNFAVDCTESREIHALLGSETQKILDNHGAVLKFCFDQFGHDPERLQQEVYKRTGQRITRTPIKKFVKRNKGQKLFKVDESFFVERLRENPEVLQEVKAYFIANPPRDTQEVGDKIEEKLGWQPPEETIELLMNEHGIRTRGDILRDPEVKKAILEHFIENPPEDVEEGIRYVEQQYGITVKEELMARFIAFAAKKR